MQQAADQNRAQRVVTTDAVAVAGVGEVERPAECKPGVGCTWAPSPGCGLTLLSEGRELLPTSRALILFFVSPAFCFSVAFAISAFLAFSFSFAIRTPLADAFLCTIYVESNIEMENRRLTSLRSAKGTSTTSVRRSCNSMPSRIRLFRVLKNVFILAHCRKCGCVGKPAALSSLPRDCQEIGPGGVSPSEDKCGEMYCWRAEDEDLPES
jgi:hypothetical protein